MSALTFLHLSDLHFRQGVSNTQFDRDADIRRQLERDVEQKAHLEGLSIDAILISGDIAFAGQPEEFEMARKWFDALADQLNVHGRRQFWVPGNHDSDRGVVRKDATLRMMHRDIRANRDEATERLYNLLRDNDAAERIYRPLAAYNKAASDINCNFSAENLCWYQDIEISQEWTVRLCGLNSALISDEDDDERGNLLIGIAGQHLREEDGVIWVAMSHHPCNWLLDGRAIEHLLDIRASLQIYGHEHDHRARIQGNGVRIAAGAVQPEHAEVWEPAYNIIRLQVGESSLHVKVWTREWQSRQIMNFRSVEFGGGRDFFEHTIRLSVAPKRIAIPPITSLPPSEETVTIVASEDGALPLMPQILQEDEPDLPELLARFFQLPDSLAIPTLAGLQLWEPGDAALREEDRMHKICIRAAEQGKSEALRQAIQGTLKKID